MYAHTQQPQPTWPPKAKASRYLMEWIIAVMVLRGRTTSVVTSDCMFPSSSEHENQMLCEAPSPDRLLLAYSSRGKHMVLYVRRDTDPK